MNEQELAKLAVKEIAQDKLDEKINNFKTAITSTTQEIKDIDKKLEELPIDKENAKKVLGYCERGDLYGLEEFQNSFSEVEIKKLPVTVHRSNDDWWFTYSSKGFSGFSGYGGEISN